MGCAQCHDHKYDPITQKDYYRLYAFFDSAQEANIEAPLPGELGPYLHSKQEYNRQRKELLDEYKVAPLYDQWEKKILENRRQFSRPRNSSGKSPGTLSASTRTTRRTALRI